MAASASASVKAAQETLSDQLLDSWSDSEIKAWADKNGIKGKNYLVESGR